MDETFKCYSQESISYISIFRTGYGEAFREVEKNCFVVLFLVLSRQNK